MEFKEPCKDGCPKDGKVIRSKTMKKAKKDKQRKQVSEDTNQNHKDDKMDKQAESRSLENVSVGNKRKGKKNKQEVIDHLKGHPSNSPNDKNKPIKKKKKKNYNKGAIEKMKERQRAKKEKLMWQNSPDAAPQHEATRRRRKPPVRLESVDLQYSEEDGTMVQFEGVWVPSEETGRLQSARQDLERRGLSAERVSRRMKQLVRREHRKLKIRLIAAQTKAERAARERRQFLAARETPRVRRRLPGRGCGLILQETEQLARFEGFWVSAEAVPRLEALRQSLLDEGRTEDEAGRLLRRARRQEERRVKSSGRLLCTRCGGRGHLLSDCAAQAAAGTACFRCGEAGHRLSDCPKKGEISGLPFATCFLCKQQGHMSRDCPQAETGRRPGKTGQRPGKVSGGQSWRGLTHDNEPAEESVIQQAPSVTTSKQKARVHIRFD